MSVLTTIASSDLITDSRAVINDNFTALNDEKIETSYLDTDSTLAANSDTKIPSQKAIRAYVDAGGTASNLERLLPVGSILPYGGSTAPNYFFLCDGSSKAVASYPALYAVIGYTYGGSGANFSLPNLKNRIPMGAGANTVVATFASRASNVITVTGLTNAANNEFQTGQAVVYHTSATEITGLTNDATYYLIRTGNLTFSLASSLANAQNASVVSLSGDGTGVQTFTLTMTTRTLGDTGGEENHAMSSTELLSHSHYISGGGSSTYGEVSGDWSTSPSLTTSPTGGNVAMNNLQPFLTINYIIKY